MFHTFFLSLFLLAVLISFHFLYSIPLGPNNVVKSYKSIRGLAAGMVPGAVFLLMNLQFKSLRLALN